MIIRGREKNRAALLSFNERICQWDTKLIIHNSLGADTRSMMKMSMFWL